MRAMPLRGMPPPSSDTLIETSSFPPAITTSMCGRARTPRWVSTTARMEFFSSSNSMWYRWEGMYLNARRVLPATRTSGASE